MLQALLKGKLSREEEDMEDLLTSNVFGSVKYVPFNEGLIHILSSATKQDNSSPLKNLEGKVEKVRYEFWPWLNKGSYKGCEPDVLITLKHVDGKKTIVLVEAKYYSSMSSEVDVEGKPISQLEREWQNLATLAEEKKAYPVLLYITADFSYPREDISTVNKENEQKGEIVWISWRKLSGLFAGAKQPILKDLVKVLQSQGLIFYEGLHVKLEKIRLNWFFISESISWNWASFKTLENAWSFKDGFEWKWSIYKRLITGWRYSPQILINRNYIIRHRKWRFGA